MKFFKHAGSTFRKTNRLAIEKRLEKGEKVRGFMVGNKVNNHHWFGGWHLASGFIYTDKKEFVKHWNHALFYLEPELGSGLAVWVEVE